jgi:hypothetical protein
MKVTGPSGQIYAIGHELGKSERFKFYQCAHGDNKACILKIARKKTFNGLLDKEAYILQILDKEAFELEEEYGMKNATDKKLGYDFFFPKLLESFVVEEQGGSRINVLSLARVANDLSELTPLSHLTSQEMVRVDPETSAWILGKTLKALCFAHSQDILIQNLTGDNIFINREQQNVTIFDWTEATPITWAIPENLAAEEISKVAKTVVMALGGNPVTGELLADNQLTDNSYEVFIRSLINADERNVFKAHEKFYELILALWPRKSHKFTTYCLTNQEEE